MSARPRSAAVGIIAAGGVVTLFVGFVLVSKLGLRSTMAPWDITALRFGVAATVMLPVVLRHGFLGLGFWRVLMLAGSGGLGFALCAYWGFALAPANHGSALIHGTLPLTTATVTAILARAWPTRWQCWSSVAVLLGVAALLRPGLEVADGHQLAGDLLLLAASLCWSSFGLLCSRWRPPPFAAAALVAVVSGLVYLPFYLRSGVGQLHNAALADILQQGFFQGLAIGVGSILMYSTAVATIGPTATALAAALVPALTAAGAVLLLDERMEATEVAGVALITLGVMLGAMGAMGETKGRTVPDQTRPTLPHSRALHGVKKTRSLGEVRKRRRGPPSR
jgi:drug/metabolite transporter (DMT)-like permease